MPVPLSDHLFRAGPTKGGAASGASFVERAWVPNQKIETYSICILKFIEDKKGIQRPRASTLWPYDEVEDEVPRQDRSSAGSALQEGISIHCAKWPLRGIRNDKIPLSA